MSNIPEIIEIRPIPDRNGIREFSTDLEYFSQAHTIGPFVSPATNKFVTGLEKEDLEYLKKLKFPHDLDAVYHRGQPHPFWESRLVKIDLLSTPVFLYPSVNPYHFIQYKYLLKSDFVYSSKEEMENGGKPEATHFIFNATKEVELKAKKIQELDNIKDQISKLSIAKKRNLILLVLNEITENKNEDYITVRMDDILSSPSDLDKLIMYLGRSDEEMEALSYVKKAISANVLTRTVAGIMFFETVLGFDVEDVAKELVRPENQALYIRIQEGVTKN